MNHSPENRPLKSQLRDQLSARIRERLEGLEISRSDAARMAGVSISQIGRLYNNHDTFTLDRLVQAAESLGLTIEVKAAAA